MHPSPPSSPSRASSPRAVLAPLDEASSDNKDMNAALDTPERDRRDRKDSEEWYKQYATVYDKDGNDISHYAPPALKVFWAQTYHTLCWQIRRTCRACICPSDAWELNSERRNLLHEMTEWYKQLVQQEAGVARLLRPARRR